MRVGADTLHLVAAALMRLMRSAFGRRLTVTAVLASSLAQISHVQRELTCLTDPLRAADEDSMLLQLLLMLLLLLLMLMLGHERMHLVIVVSVVVAVVITMLTLLVVGAGDNVDLLRS